MPSAKGDCKAPIRTDVHICVFYRSDAINFLSMDRARRYGSVEAWLNRVEVPVRKAM